MMPPPGRWPRLGLGCATLGTPPPALDDDVAEAVMRTAVERGIRYFDVAPLYGGGLAEERLGRVLEALPRDSYVLSTKTGVTRPYGETAQPPGATRRRQFDVWDYSAAATRVSIQASLGRLRTERLDVVHLHDAEHHLDTCLDAHAELRRLRDEGIVGAIGIGSNQVEPVSSLLARARFDAILLAGRFTLLDTSGDALIADARARGVAVIAGGVFNSGVLAAWPPTRSTYDYLPAERAVVERTARIAAICERHGVPLAAAALQFVLANPAIGVVLLGPGSVEDLDANLAAAQCRIPGVLWKDLADADLIARESPVLAGATPGARPGTFTA